MTFGALPKSTEETVVTWKMFVHKDAQEGVDFSIDEFTSLWANTNQEDKELSEIRGRKWQGLPVDQVPTPRRWKRIACVVDWYYVRPESTLIVPRLIGASWHKRRSHSQP